MYEALIITLPMEIGGSFISYLLYKVVHLNDKAEITIKEKPKKVLFNEVC